MAAVKKKNVKRTNRQGHPISQGHKPFKDEMFDKKENVKKLRDLAGLFFNVDQIATQFGVHRATFYTILDRRPHLREVIEQGKNDSLRVATSELMKHVKKGDKEMIKFALRSKGGWKEQIEVKVEGTVKQEITLEAVKRVDQMNSDDRLARRILLEKNTSVSNDSDENIIDVEVI